MKAPAAALRAIKTAVGKGAWRPDPHLFKQMATRGLTLVHVLAAIQSARRIEPHDMLPLHEHGTSWRLHGKDSDDRLLGVGVELVEDAGLFVVVITAFVKDGP